MGDIKHINPCTELSNLTRKHIKGCKKCQLNQVILLERFAQMAHVSEGEEDWS